MKFRPFRMLCATGVLAIFSSTISKSPVLQLFAKHLGGGLYRRLFLCNHLHYITVSQYCFRSQPFSGHRGNIGLYSRFEQPKSTRFSHGSTWLHYGHWHTTGPLVSGIIAGVFGYAQSFLAAASVLEVVSLVFIFGARLTGKS